MILAIETIILCIIFFLLCFGGTGTDDKNLKSYSSYPDKVQNQIKEIIEYQGRFKESNKIIVFISNFLLFLPLFFILGLFIRENNFYYIKTNYPVTPRQKRSRCRSNRGIIDSPTPLFTPFCRFRSVSYTHLPVYPAGYGQPAAVNCPVRFSALPVPSYLSSFLFRWPLPLLPTYFKLSWIKGARK